ncbi:MAG: ribonuclease III [Halobacteriovoraceae bacterium]|nr:ribonuclease III [Halobacteriovoraceae bacterium]MCB9094237.1 ribonuclease III [Halobacteriovoraceae bacterium]
MTSADLSWQDDLEKLAEILGYSFHNNELVQTAFIHTSYFHENQNIFKSSNERLEFLGDSVLSLVVSRKIYEKFSTESEGKLSQLRSAIVNENQLYQFALFFNLQNYLKVGKGEERSGGRMKVRNLSRCFEALIGAVYLDSDYATTEKVILGLIDQYEKNQHSIFSLELLEDFDPKTKLQEEVLKFSETPPIYQSEQIGESQYKISIVINEKVIDSMTGNSKKKIEKKLAQKVLKEKKYVSQSASPQ